jgi:hypothetical protein
MSIKVIEEKLRTYHPKNTLEAENALKEITQEIALAGLARAGFFKVASFQGGTALRILYGLNRFSEDLDFALHKPSKDFNWLPYLQALKTELEAYGYDLEIDNRDSKSAVKVGFIKDDSIGKLLVVDPRRVVTGANKKMIIKLEVDTHAPSGAIHEQKYVDFPTLTPISAHAPSSLFAGKSHALLCREWEKGRDWFDFLWYVSRETEINYKLLSNAIYQAGPWKGQKIKVNRAWYLKALTEKINHTQWRKQKEDVIRFLKTADLPSLELWKTDFFLQQVERMEGYLK